MMSDFEARMAALGLKLPAAEIPKLEAIVKDLERASAFVRSVERSYLEEPSTVIRLAPVTTDTNQRKG
jgi:hypothetical protein